MAYQIHQGNNIDTLKTLKDNSVDAVITDPPYGIDFLGKAWDANTGALETYQECLRVLKPGGYILAFSAARTYHHLAVTLEQAGFEIRDQLMWLYASGFPKAQDIGKAIDKRGGMVSNDKDTKSLKTMLTDLFKASGKSNSQINKECGFNASGYLRQHDNGVDGWGYALPLNDKWHALKKVLNCSDEYDKYFVSSEREVIGSKETGCFDTEFQSHTIGARSKTVDITAPATKQASQWHGWKSALKPAHEPICMARKPFKGSCIDNVLEHGLGALNIDESRIGIQGADTRSGGSNGVSRLTFGEGETSNEDSSKPYDPDTQGRFPTNVIGEVSEEYQKYFYCPKVSRKERHCGFEAPPDPLANYSQGDVKNHPLWDPSIGTNIQRLKHKILEHNKDLGKKSLDHIPALFGNVKGAYVDGERMAKVADDTGYANVGNNHPTVKPVALMRYLIKLVTPPNSTVLDPFCGSGSTGMAAVELGHTFIGCELDPAYVEISKRRIEAWNTQETDNQFTELFEEVS